MVIKWVLLIALSTPVLSLDNGLALTPPMGWLTWQRFRCTTDCRKFPTECISERLIERTALRMVKDGYLAAGYNYIAIDDCWLAKRRVNGRIVPDKIRFPKGIKALSDYVHNLGLKFGIYEDYGNWTCGGFPGVYGHEQDDIDTFVEWGVDYVKLDGCFSEHLDVEAGYIAFGKKMNESGRPMVYSCSWPDYVDKPDYEAIARTCNLWRNSYDIDDSWASLRTIMKRCGDNQVKFAKYAGPGHWNDLDMLIIGNFGLSVDQAKVQMAVWAVLAAPLLMSADLDTIRLEFKEILLNRDIIAVNQDKLGKQGLRVWKTAKPDYDIWKRELADASYAIAFVNYNEDGMPHVPSFSFAQMNLTSGDYKVVDLYREDPDRCLKNKHSLQIRINPTGVKFYKFIPTDKCGDKD